MIINFTPIFEEALNYPPVPCKSLIPNWFKTLPISSDSNTVKKCPAVVDFLSSGYFLRSHEDFSFKRTVINNEEEILIKGNLTSNTDTDKGITTILNLGHHIHEQMPIVSNDIKKSFWKFNQWWTWKTPKGYSSLILPNYYNFNFWQIIPTIIDTDNDFKVPQGLVAHTNINDNQAHEWEIKKGDPIAIIVPYKRDEWVAEYEGLKLENKKFSFDKNLQNYKKEFWNKKLYS